MNKISIKEAGRYANFLQERILEFSHIPYASIDSKLEKITETHLKSKAISGADDEVVETENTDIYDISPEETMEILEKLINEKVLLAIAISTAKSKNLVNIDGQKMDIDSAIEYSKKLRDSFVDFFTPLLNRKEGITKQRASGYAFNVEGNQVSYIYEVEKIRKLKYDKDIFIQKQKEVLLLADKLSVSVDKIMNSDIVEFIPKYNYLDSVEDIIKDNEQTK